MAICKSWLNIRSEDNRWRPTGGEQSVPHSLDTKNGVAFSPYFLECPVSLSVFSPNFLHFIAETGADSSKLGRLATLLKLSDCDLIKLLKMLLGQCLFCHVWLHFLELRTSEFHSLMGSFFWTSIATLILLHPRILPISEHVLLKHFISSTSWSTFFLMKF